MGDEVLAGNLVSGVLRSVDRRGGTQTVCVTLTLDDFLINIPNTLIHGQAVSC